MMLFSAMVFVAEEIGGGEVTKPKSLAKQAFIITSCSAGWSENPWLSRCLNTEKALEFRSLR